ncbi:DUF1549 domain-containing protein [Planctomicrobium sp. SH668]|uniref:DUF1549 domain-containing protein n=1 Tax=Planctomicrobium sp. SH668 TaxID=3448126 RepID=UPI003F5BA2F3
MRIVVRIFFAFLTLSLLASSIGVADDSLIVFPQNPALVGPESSQRLLLQRQQGDVISSQISDGVEWTSSDESVATVNQDGVVVPHQNGSATISAKVDGKLVSVTCSVTQMDVPHEWNFNNHVLPILTKAGCNMGACHGTLAGKGGFRLSLRGYDPNKDYFNIVLQDRGRRVEFADPGRSLVLAKPSGGLPHKGGVRIDTESRDYRILAEWISHGAQASPQGAPVIEEVKVLPEKVRLVPGQTQQLIAVASYSDGTKVDVTQWVKWSSSNDAVSQVNDHGVVTVVGPGEGAITGWFNSRVSVARVQVPYSNELPQDLFANLPERNFIDAEIHRQLQALNLPPSPPCDDSTFIRRAFLDTIGVLPTAAEVQSFLGDANPDKREKLVDQLLARPEFVDYWTYKWSDVLMLNGTLLRPKAIESYYKWIHAHVEKNTPWDLFVSEILTAKGGSFDQGATNFYALFQSPEEMTENASQAFLGLSLNCAKCHDHPLEKWTNDQYYAMANHFARVRAKGWGGDFRGGDGNRTLFVADSGELVQPRTGKPQLPTPLDGTPIPLESTVDRREYLAQWMVSPGNPYFAKSIANRVWANFFGAGLVESVDDMRASNPPSNQVLLDKVAAFVVQEKFNLKSLMREILLSNSYQRSSLTMPGNEQDKRFYSTYLTRRLNAEVLHDAVAQATGVPTEFSEIAFPGADKEKTSFYPLGTRAIQLYDSAVDSYFLKTFGRNQRNIVCECERSNEPSMVQVLHMSNGSTINEKLESPTGIVAKLTSNLNQGLSPESVIDEAYLVTLSRYPTPAERAGFVAILNEGSVDDRRVAVEDLFWALVTSREFVFNH